MVGNAVFDGTGDTMIGWTSGQGRRGAGAKTWLPYAFFLFPFVPRVLRISGIVRDSPWSGKIFFGTTVLFFDMLPSVSAGRFREERPLAAAMAGGAGGSRT